uniref:Lysozyme g n=1 Tax=Ciona intestinalis TaxID=7719 RepID=A0A1D8EIR6_CIOIN|nr:g-type lysozyme 2 [Ciona intestinalis]
MSSCFSVLSLLLLVLVFCNGDSFQIPKDDVDELLKLRSSICYAAEKAGVPSALLAGIISRVSGAGRMLNENGYGQHGYGVMQIAEKHGADTKFGPFSRDHILQGAQILHDLMHSIHEKHPGIMMDQQFRGGILAYRVGVENLRPPDLIHSDMPEQQYANDILRRTSFFEQQGFGRKECTNIQHEDL